MILFFAVSLKASPARFSPPSMISRSSSLLIRLSRVSLRHLLTEGCPAVRCAPVSAIPTNSTLRSAPLSLSCFTSSAKRCRSREFVNASTSSIRRSPLSPESFSATHEGDASSRAPANSRIVVVCESTFAPNPGIPMFAAPPSAFDLEEPDSETSMPTARKGAATTETNVSALSHRFWKSSPAINLLSSNSDAMFASELLPTPRSPNNSECCPGVFNCSISAPTSF